MQTCFTIHTNKEHTSNKKFQKSFDKMAVVFVCIKNMLLLFWINFSVYFEVKLVNVFWLFKIALKEDGQR